MNNKSNKQKAIILLLDGWSLTSKTFNCFFHKNIDSFFRSLLANFRSLPIAKNRELEPQKTFFAGKEIFNHRRLIQDIQAPNVFWQNPKVNQAVLSLKRSGGRLWFLKDEPDQFFDQLFDQPQLHGHSKIGVYYQKETSSILRSSNHQSDLLITTLSNRQRFQLKPEDILIYFCDFAEINQFRLILNRQRYRPLRSMVLTDNEEQNLLDIIVENKLSPNFSTVLLENNFAVSDVIIDPAQRFEIDQNADLTFVYLPFDYFDFDLPSSILRHRRDHLIQTIESLLHQNTHTHKIMVTSRFGDPQNQSGDFELLPFIIIDHKLDQNQKISSPIENHLSFGRTIADIAPTILDLFAVEKPAEMSGCSLLGTLYPEHYLGDHARISMRLPSPTPRSMFE